VFTIVDRGVVVWYPGIMERDMPIMQIATDGSGGVVEKSELRSMRQILGDEFGRELRVIRTGGGDEHFASREQRTDGTNILAIAPGVACTYRRNTRTIAAMEAAGVKVLKISGSELVRGLGGPRCMTMPLRRSAADK
jgi:arginine deiminase